MRYTGNTIIKSKELDLGIDLSSASDYCILPGEIQTVSTAIRIEFPQFTEAQKEKQKEMLGFSISGLGGLVWPRGRNDYVVLAGVIDCGYRGEILVKIFNSSQDVVYINSGDRIAQLVLIPVIDMFLEKVLDIDRDTDRGESGGIWEK